MMRTTQIFFLLGLLLPLCTVVTSNTIKKPENGSRKPGECPPERYYNKDSKITHILCTNDFQCQDNWKCCQDNGYMMCKPPAKEKPGDCPVFNPSLAPATKCNDNCTSDSECRGNGKCCLKYCGHTCCPPQSDIGKPITESEADKGFCFQEALYKCFEKERYTCDEASCTDGMKCCPHICRVECRPFLKERNGKCSANADCPTGEKNVSCTSDHNCARYHKCCSTSCGQKCVQAVDIKLNIHNPMH